MDPGFSPDWADSKPSSEYLQNRGSNVTASWQSRETGLKARGCVSNSKVLQEAAEDRLVKKAEFKERSCELPGVPRSTFLMVFSPDGTIVASTHGNHKIYISDLATCKHIKTLSGHPRTPWCVAFHPSRPQVLGSGCLGGQVRVWDLNGGSEVWTVQSKTVIASIAFHPRDRLLVIATYNELYFWDWSQPQPFTKVNTVNLKEKVRFVSFDTLGYKLITGISVHNSPNIPGPIHNIPAALVAEHPPATSYPPGFLGYPIDREVPSYYSQLVHRYNNLVRNYRHLFVSQQSHTTTTDRGTDPMDIEAMQNSQNVTTASNNSRNESVPNTSGALSSTSNSAPSVSMANNDTGNVAVSDAREGTSNTNNSSVNDSPQSQERSRSEESGSTEAATSGHRREFRRGSRVPLPTAFRALSNGDWTSVSFIRTMREINDTLRVELSTLRQSGSGADPSPSSTNRPEGTSAPSQPSDNNPSPPNNLDADSLPNVEPATHPPQGSEAAHTPAPNRPEASPPSTSPMDEDSYDMRSELTDSLNRLQGYMESSIDETLHLIEFNALDGGSPFSAPGGFSEENSRHVPFPEGPSSSNGSNRSSWQTNNATRSRSRQDSLDMNFEEHLNNIIRDSSHSFVNLVSDSAEFGNVRRIIQHLRTRREVLNSERSRSPSRNAFMSSDDDGSNSDREIFSPLPVQVTRSRYLLPERNLENFTIDTITIDPTSTSTISRHIDHEYIRRNNRPINRPSSLVGFLRMSDIPMPSRPDSPTFPTNMLTPSMIGRLNRNSNSNDSRLNMPSTSRHSFESVTRQQPRSANEQNQNDNESNRAFLKVARGVQAIQKHTSALINLCSNRSSMQLKHLRRMWDDLRREVISIHRQLPSQSVPSQAVPSYFTLTPRERRDLLTATVELNVNNTVNQEGSSRQNPDQQSQSGTSSSTTPPDSSPSTGSPSPSNSNLARLNLYARLFNHRTYPPSSRLQTRLRYANRERIRLRSYLVNRLNRLDNSDSTPRRSERCRLSYTREHELTRIYIRCHARRVLTIMFSIMMDCLEVDNLEEQLIAMLRSLKKALGLTCLLLISQSFRNSESQTSNNDIEPTQPRSDANTSTVSGTANTESRSRIAVQISAANRNNSYNARRRRESYYLLKRSQALRMRSSNPTGSVSGESSPARDTSSRSTTQNPTSSRSDSTNARKRKELYYFFKKSQALRNRNSLLRSQPRRRDPAASATNTTASTSSATSDMPRPSTSGLQNLRRSETVHNLTSATTQPSTSGTTNSTTSQQSTSTRMYHGLLRRFLNSNNGFFRDMNSSNWLENMRSGAEAEDAPHFIAVQEPSVNNNPRGNAVPIAEEEIPLPFLSFLRQHFVRVSDPPGQGNLFGSDENNVWGISSGPNLIIETVESPIHRIQMWDFSNGQLPDIGNNSMNVVVPRCKIHNDASIDISRDGRLLVALLPPHTRNSKHRLGIYSLDWDCLGECFYTAALEQNVVSISLSPCGKHLAVGLGSQRMSLQPYGRNGIMAFIYRLGEIVKTDINTRRGTLKHIRRLEHNWELGFTSLNCLRWAPQPGQGLVYANNTGQLKILS